MLASEILPSPTPGQQGLRLKVNKVSYLSRRGAVALRDSERAAHNPSWKQPRGKLMVSSVNFHTNATRIGWHLWEIDLRFALFLPPGWRCINHMRICVSCFTLTSTKSSRRRSSTRGLGTAPPGSIGDCRPSGETPRRNPHPHSGLQSGFRPEFWSYFLAMGTICTRTIDGLSLRSPQARLPQELCRTF